MNLTLEVFAICYLGHVLQLVIVSKLPGFGHTALERIDDVIADNFTSDAYRQDARQYHPADHFLLNKF